ncbi:MAG: SpaA isopeptide-forming pilin-related protein, partial [Oscillospiraceae bacterium]
GVAEFINVPYGKYYCVEENVNLPTGYLYNSKQTEIFEVKEDKVADKTTYDLTKDNRYIIKNKLLRGSAKLTKVGEDGKFLQGAEIGVFRKNGDLKIGNDVTTDAKGVAIVTDLPYGDYYFMETKAPAGYNVNNKHIDFEIRADGDDVNTTPDKKDFLVDSFMRATIKVHKVEMGGETGLQGAKIALLDGSGTEIQQGVTDKDGYLKFEGLLQGDYRIKEIIAPAGFILKALPSDVISIPFNNGNQTYEVKMENQRMSSGNNASFYDDGKGGTRTPPKIFPLIPLQEAKKAEKPKIEIVVLPNNPTTGAN